MFGFRLIPMKPALHMRFLKTSAIITLSVCIRHLATWHHETFLLVQQSAPLTMVLVLVRRKTACTSTFLTPSIVLVVMLLLSVTETCLRCMNAFLVKTRTKCRCVFTPPRTTQWAACGLTTSCKRPFLVCTQLVKQTSLTMAQTAWVLAH